MTSFSLLHNGNMSACLTKLQSGCSYWHPHYDPWPVLLLIAIRWSLSKWPGISLDLAKCLSTCGVDRAVWMSNSSSRHNNSSVNMSHFYFNLLIQCWLLEEFTVWSEMYLQFSSISVSSEKSSFQWSPSIRKDRGSSLGTFQGASSIILIKEWFINIFALT